MCTGAIRVVRDLDSRTDFAGRQPQRGGVFK